MAPDPPFASPVETKTTSSRRRDCRLQPPPKAAAEILLRRDRRRLFDPHHALPEYYPTRSELDLLREHAPDIASLFPQASALVEFGSGSSRKARILLRAAASVEAYVPVDISGDFLREDAVRLRRDFPHLSIIPVVADFTAMAELPGEIAAMPRAGFFPGSTIGNFEPHEAARSCVTPAAYWAPGRC